MKNPDILQESLPFDNTKRLLGMLSIVLSPFLVGFILGLVAVYLTDKDKRMYQSFPSSYSENALKKHQISRRWALAGGIASSIFTIVIIYFYYNYGTANPSRLAELLK
jgi:hypothetical protein